MNQSPRAYFLPLLASLLVIGFAQLPASAQEVDDDALMGIFMESSGKMGAPILVQPWTLYTAYIAISGVDGMDQAGVSAWEASLTVAANPSVGDLLIIRAEPVPSSALNLGSGTDFQVGNGTCEIAAGGSLIIAEIDFMVTGSFTNGTVGVKRYVTPSAGLLFPGVLICGEDRPTGVPNVSGLILTTSPPEGNLCDVDAPLVEIARFTISGRGGTDLVIDRSSGDIFMAHLTTTGIEFDPGSGIVCRYSAFGDELGCYALTTETGEDDHPSHLAIDPSSTQLVATGQTRWHKYTLDGVFIEHLRDDNLDWLWDPASVWGTSFDPFGRLLFTVNASGSGFIKRYYPASRVVDTIPNPSFPHESHLGLGAGELLWLDSTAQIACIERKPKHAQGDEWGENRIRVIDPATGLVQVDIGSTWGTDPGQFRAPFDLAEGSDDRIYVCDIDRIHVTDRLGAFKSQNFEFEQEFHSIDAVSNGRDDFVYVMNVADHLGDDREVRVYSSGIEFVNVLGTRFLDPADNYHFNTADMAIYDSCAPDPTDTTSTLVTKIAADQISRVLVRLELPQAHASMTLSLDDATSLGSSQGIGELKSLDRVQTGQTIALPTEEINGRHYLLAEYRAPAEFEREGMGDEERGERGVRFLLSVGEALDFEVGVLEIVRPTIVMVHGLYSRDEAWFDFPSFERGSPWRRRYVDYRTTHGSSIDVNLDLIRDQFEIFWHLDRNAGIAAAQFDVLAHSMGGVLVREFAEDSSEHGYRSDLNAGHGYFNKLLLMNVPNEGSPLAITAQRLLEAGNEFADVSTDDLTLASLTKIFLRRIIGVTAGQEDAGALADLRPGSAALASIGSAVVPHRYFVGLGSVGGFLLLGSSPGLEMLTRIYLMAGVPELGSFLSEYSDWVVPESSQRFGMPAEFQAADLFPISGFHTMATSGSPIAASEAEAMARTGILAVPGYFAGTIPAGGGTGKSLEEWTGRQTPTSLRTPLFSGLSIQLSSASTLPEYGESVQANVQVSGGYQVEELFILSNAGGEVLTQEPFMATFVVSNAVQDALRIMAVAKTTSNELLLSDVVELGISGPDVTSAGINIEPETIVLKSGEMRSIGVRGRVSVAEAHPIPQREVSYSLEDGTIARMLENGFIQGLDAGATVLHIATPTGSAEVPVLVVEAEPINHKPQPIVPFLVRACPGEQIVVSAAASTDPDEVFGDALTFAWDTNLDGVYDDGSGTSMLVTFEPGTTDFVRVKVSDSGGAYSYGLTAIVADPSMCSNDAMCQLNSGSPGIVYLSDPVDVESDGSGFVISDGADKSLVFIDSACKPVTRVRTGLDELDAIAVDGVGGAWSQGLGGPESIRCFASPDGAPCGFVGSILENPVRPLRFASDREGDALFGGLFFNKTVGPDQVITRSYFSPTAVSWNSGEAPDRQIHPDAELCYSQSAIFIVDRDRVIRLNHQPAGPESLTYAGAWGSSGTGDGEFVHAVDIAARADGKILVLDRVEKEIQEFDPAGEHVRTIDLEVQTGIAYENPIALAVNDESVVAVVDAGRKDVTLFILPNAPTSAPDMGGRTSLSMQRTGPNPGGSSFQFTLSGLRMGTDLSVKVYDVRGRLIRTVYSGFSSGSEVTVQWNRVDGRGVEVASGIYFVKVVHGGEIATEKVAVLR